MLRSGAAGVNLGISTGLDRVYPMAYDQPSNEIRETQEFAKWRASVGDRRAAHRINVRIRRLIDGLCGDARPVGGGVSELRIDYGPGYRVYFLQRGSHLILLLGGGTKATQSRDIARAISLARQLRG